MPTKTITKNEVITIIRVPYGKKETLPNEREYWLESDAISPVGTVAEWSSWAGTLITPKRIRVIDKLMGEDYEIEL